MIVTLNLRFGGPEGYYWSSNTGWSKYSNAIPEWVFQIVLLKEK